MPQTWSEAIADRKFVVSMVGWSTGLVLFVIFIPNYLNGVILEKPGIQLNDFMFELLPPRDWSIAIFVLIFGAPALFILSNYKSPATVLLCLQCYVTVSFMRMVTIYLFTLEAPEGIIPLVDPFLEKVVYGGNALFVKDLFFSGHTSTLFIVFLIEKRKPIKAILLLSTLLVGLFLVWQRVHYSIDVVGAVFVSWAVYWLFTKVNSQIDLKKKGFRLK
jgi:membrane-associated phospholipid phosphatase